MIINKLNYYFYPKMVGTVSKVLKIDRKDSDENQLAVRCKAVWKKGS